ncbi:MAG: HAMP domain-containing sensor histidine kinase [Campylobacterota bacterium]|nr:HAMP domain-containing sensor histidine kinase [Campylobacterota bacterium]
MNPFKFLFSASIHLKLMLFFFVSVFVVLVGGGWFIFSSSKAMIHESQADHINLVAKTISPKISVSHYLFQSDRDRMAANFKMWLDLYNLDYIKYTPAANGKVSFEEKKEAYSKDDPYNNIVITYITAPFALPKSDGILGTLELGRTNTEELTHFIKNYTLFASALLLLLLILIVFENILLTKLLGPIKNIGRSLMNYKPGDSIDIKQHLDTISPEVRNIALSFLRMQKNIDTAIREKEDEMERSKAKDTLLMHQARFVEMGTMIANIAHQWKQPLHVINATVGDLMFKTEIGKLDKEYRMRQYQDISQQIDHMSNTINVFKTFLSAEEEDGEGTFNVSMAVFDALELVAGSLKKEHIDIKTHLSKDDADLAKGRAAELEQVIVILINNAIDAINQNEGKAREIVVAVSTNTHSIHLSIKDSGGGIPDEVMDKIYDAYFSSKHQAHGTGLGLFIAKTIVEIKLLGRIKASNTDMGARFDIRLPLTDTPS